MSRPLITLALLAATATAAAGDDPEFTLGLESLRLSSLDPRTEARLAQWNSPMGRTEYAVRQQQAEILAGGQPGGPPGAIAFRVKVQGKVDPRFVAAMSAGGVELYERTIDVIRWPWRDSDERTLSFEEQLSLMLGDRLRRSVGDPD
jgi:hypothetical protein